MVTVLLLSLLLLAAEGMATNTISLNGQWIVSSGDISVPGTVPGSMYTALIASGRIGDPYFRMNDKEYGWIGDRDWAYTRTFQVTADTLAYPRVVLVCEGLDTVATVTVNNQTVGTSMNMFVRYVYDIKQALVVGQNSITVQFQSATGYVKQVASSLPYDILPTCVPPQYHGACGANLIRKTQCSFSWDWGPSFPTQGIWRDIYIQAYNTAVIRDVTSETSKNADGTWHLKVDIFMETIAQLPVHGQLEVKLYPTSVTSSKQVNLVKQNDSVSFNINIPKSAAIDEWWPNGYGNQSLYDLYVFYTDSLGTMNNKKIRIGFRTVELVQDYVSVNKSLGRTFYFRINGRPIFLKGSNWIPADSFLERVTRDRVYNYLKSAADVHMNTLRVWGGGIYEMDIFYEIADELGIMLWQDFMFACAMYPTHPAFIDSVKQEVTYQVRRMKHHPSIIVLSGNNENEKALVQDWYGTGVNFTLYKADYLKLYIDTVRSIVMAEDTSRPFLASSPSNGVETQAEGWVANAPYDTHYGDIHEYKYLTPFYDPSVLRIPRMCSEYGLQSYPSLEGLEPVYNDTDMDYWSDLNDYRNHHPFGNVEMMAEAIQYVNLPNCPDRKQRFSDLIYVTQIDHAVGMRTWSEHYRRWQNRLDSDGQGNTMGALYWMLADIWQAPTWASIEYGGKWKMLHYYAANFFAPTIISPTMDGDFLDVYIVMDEIPVKETRQDDTYQLIFKPKTNPRPFSIFDLNTWGNPPASHTRATGPPSEFDGTLHIEMYSWNSFTALKTWSVPFTMNTTAQSVFRADIDTMVQSAQCTRRSTCFLVLHFGDRVAGPSTWYTLSTFSGAQGLEKAKLQISNLRASTVQNQFTFTLTSDKIAPFVWLEAIGMKGRFSDNGFLMYQPNMTLTYLAWEAVDVNKLSAALTVKSLMDVYY